MSLEDLSNEIGIIAVLVTIYFFGSAILMSHILDRVEAIFKKQQEQEKK